MQFHLTIAPGDTAGTANLVSKDLPVRREGDGDVSYILLGQIYELKFTTLAALAETLSGDQRYPRGRFLLIQINRATKTVDFWLDKYRLMTPMIFVDELGFQLSNQFWKLRFTKPPTADALAVETLKKYGAVLYPHTLVQEVKFVSGSGRASLETQQIQMNDSALDWPTEGDRGPGPAEWVETLRRSTHDLVEAFALRGFRVSGGVDSRLISLLLSKAAAAKMQAQVLCHPALAPSEDRDVLGAQATARMVDMNLQVLSPSFSAYNYVGPEGREGVCLSGLYGGEFFGGLMYQFAPWLKTEPEPGPWSERLKLLGLRRMSTELFLSAFRSTIYESVRNSWSNPWCLHVFAISPFTEQRFLDVLLSTPDSELENYRMYAQVFSLVAGPHAFEPLTSPIVHLREGFHAFREGREPKAMPGPTLTVTPTVGSVNQRNLTQFFLEYPALGGEIDQENRQKNEPD